MRKQGFRRYGFRAAGLGRPLADPEQGERQPGDAQQGSGPPHDVGSVLRREAQSQLEPMEGAFCPERKLDRGGWRMHESTG